MEFTEVVRRRRMVRTYSPDPVAPEVVDRLLEAARRGPSAGFTQGFGFLVLEAEADRDQFWGCVESWGGEGVRAAPVVVVPLATRDAYLDRYAEPDKGWTDRDEARWPVPYWYIDCGMATQNLLLAAVDAGLGALFFGIQRSDWPAFRAAFGIPDSHDPIGAVTIGHPAERDDAPTSARTRRRRAFDEIVHRGRW
jgi:nitroreductase